MSTNALHSRTEKNNDYFLSIYHFFFFLQGIVVLFLLRDEWSFLEIAFVGRCEVFVCLEFVKIIFFLGREAHRSANGVSIL